ncbi:MAG TPA: LLM class F420-dependent oxidoreductase [Chloroflexota bacterium]|nr:LLM class F420-dependent oxidoreductase [Chloroflexota bacterium]
MKLGLQISRFRWPGGPPLIASTLAEIARAADDAGYASIWLMDHLFQIASIGKVEEEMLEAYTTLGFLAAHTTRARLGTLVTGVHYRHPGVLVKQVTTLDVLSTGRAWLGIGAGWYERESKGLGVPFPPVKERFELLEETLKIAHQMWNGNTAPVYGKHFQLAEPLNSPVPISQPHPPILIGGGGERKTLRLVARYADACNFFARLPRHELARKLTKLRGYCDAEGRAFEAIDKTVLTQWNPARKSAQEILDQLGELRELGFDTVIASLTGVETLKPIEIVARDVFPQADRL